MYCFLYFVLLLGVEGVQTAEGEATTAAAQAVQSSKVSETPSLPTKMTPNPKTSTMERKLSTTNITATKTPLNISSKIPTCSNSEKSKEICLFCFSNTDKVTQLLVFIGISISCVFLLITTLLLCCKVCHLKKQISNSYQVCSKTDQVTTQSTKRRASPDGEHSETVIMMDDIIKPEGDEVQKESEKPEKSQEPEETEKQEEQVEKAAEVTDQASTDDEQNEKSTAESPPNHDGKMSEEVAVIAGE